ncbi:Helicase superfamily 1 UvrD-related protein [Desulfovibrio sp. X2]|uniref:UvrD-helicase domain-containing protein n=1 Tax=Desulfovibrio sp. X2 TaxID=941449 RepID=UPI00035878F9|nr:UvrD-helicase domain-containing protein [Desulfovibrio sp. X2]EPR39359.1 Helicase superfamily 1 UvrD-related protein [Desulfovibrio sp. X2]
MPSERMLSDVPREELPTARLLRIRAAAGSGKTHSLTARFLRLLGEAEARDRPLACLAAPQKGHAWPEIMAVTFTNKAAAEMKERLVRELKRRALGDFSGAAGEEWTPEHASDLLDRILRRYHALGVRTIDSLVCLLGRLFALRLHLPPDFGVTFDLAELFDPAFEEFTARCEAADGPDGEAGAALFAQAADTLLAHERKRGFRLRDTLLSRLRDMAGLFRFSTPDVVVEQQAIADLLVPSYDAFRRAAEDMLQCLAKARLSAQKNFLTALERCVGADLFSGPPDSKFLTKSSLTECVLKASQSAVTLEHEDCFRNFLDACDAYRADHAVLDGAYALAPSVALAALLAEDLAELAAREGTLPLPTLYELVRSLLTEDGAVSGAYCRLGARLHHLCLDEFQDTSLEQWTTLEPLALEALAKGGSLYCVGDVKQAIYGWRGGRAELFDDVAGGPLARLAGRHDATLPYNWRSREAVVEFNNTFFSGLADPDLAEELAGRVLGRAPSDIRVAYARDVARAFAASRQEIPPGKRESGTAAGGYVRLERIAGDKKDGDEDEGASPLREAVTRTVLSAAGRRGPGSVAVLVRTNDQAAKVSDWLMAAGLAVVTENSLHLDRHPVVRQILAFLAFLDYPPDDTALATFLTGSMFLAESGLCPSAMHDLLAVRGKGPLYLAFRAAFPEVWERLVAPFFRTAGLVRPYDAAAEIAAAFRVAERDPGHELFVRRFLEIVHQAEENGAGSLAAFLEFWADKGVQEKVPLPESVDAVRVMTIHKAKGLQFPVTVVPFHDWTVSRPDQDYGIVTVRGARVLAPIRSQAVGEAHWEVVGRMAREYLNLLYVAWTRAEDELYAFLPAEPSRFPSPVLAAIELILGDELGEETGERVLERGEPPAQCAAFVPPPPPAPRELPHKSEALELMAWLPRLRVYRHAVEGKADRQAALRGEIAHRAMELLRPVENASPAARRDLAAAAARAALAEFPEAAGVFGDPAALVGQIADMAAWVLERPELARALSEGRREAAILDDEGRTHRADLLLAADTGTLVVEYKTGGPVPEHTTQVQRYLGLAAAMAGMPRPLSGLLVYLDERRLETVPFTEAAREHTP